MSSRARPILMGTHLVPRLFTCLEEAGLESADLIARFGLPRDIASMAAIVLSTDVIRALSEQVERRLEDPSIGLRAATRVERGSYGVIEFAARNAPNLRGAIERLVRYHRLINDVVTFSAEPRPGNALALENRYPGDRTQLDRPANEFTNAVVLLLLREALGRETVAPVRAWFIHPRPADTTDVERYFGTRELEFGRDSNGLLFDAALLDEPIPTADEVLLPILDHHATLLLPYTAPTVDVLARIRAHLRQGLTGEPSLAKTATALRMSQRTLQRRLGDLGTSFNTVLDGVRAELAREYMQDPRIAIGEVAYLLGYSDARAFLRAFKRWTGEPPQQYRRRILIGREPPRRALAEHLAAIAKEGG